MSETPETPTPLLTFAREPFTVVLIVTMILASGDPGSDTSDEAGEVAAEEVGEFLSQAAPEEGDDGEDQMDTTGAVLDVWGINKDDAELRAHTALKAILDGQELAWHVMRTAAIFPGHLKTIPVPNAITTFPDEPSEEAMDVAMAVPLLSFDP